MLQNEKHVTPEQEQDEFSIRYWNIHTHERTSVYGSLAYLAQDYLAYCKVTTQINHGPASLHHDGKECGIINAKGEVYLSQSRYRKVEV